jgi:hypothetical protein
LKIDGKLEGKSLALHFWAATGGFSMLLTPGGRGSLDTASPTPPSPDGLWRGTYACTAASSTASPQSYTLDLKLRIANGTSSGGGVLPDSSNNRTMDIYVSVNPPSVSVTRTWYAAGTNTPPQRNSLPGQFDGTSIRASGRDGIGSAAYDCTLTLARVP